MTYSLYLNKTNKLLNGFTINTDNRNYKTSYFIALEKSKTLTNLLGIIYGEYITSTIVSCNASTPFGKVRIQPIDILTPEKPRHLLVCDLTDKKIQKILKSKESGEIICHLANALHNAYDSPDSVIRDLILAFGDKENLPEKYRRYWPLRNAVNHKDIQRWIKKLKNEFNELEFNESTLNRTSSINRIYLVKESFLFLHNSLDDFRKNGH